MSAPFEVTAVDGFVHITVDPATARDLSEAWATAYATCDELEADRPRWVDDVIALQRAAALAAMQTNGRPPVAMVPLRVVGGVS